MLTIGIDEAGYGPLLGPLVVSCIAIKLPDELGGMSLWELFSEATVSTPKKSSGKLIICDSKKVYSGKNRNIRELERSSLGAILLTKQKLPENLDSLMHSISLEQDPHLQHQWYCHRQLTIPNRVETQSLKLSVSMLEREMKTVKAELVAVKTVPLVEKRYNYLVSQTRNKSQVVFTQVVRLINEVMGKSDETKVQIFVDKQGGRSSYLQNLLRVFPGADIQIVSENDSLSTYRMQFGKRKIDLQFAQDGETHHFPIAWASMVSKYIRELFMLQFNRYWISKDKNIRPTAGYWKDGQRFVNDITPILNQMELSKDELIRKL